MRAKLLSDRPMNASPSLSDTDSTADNDEWEEPYKRERRMSYSEASSTVWESEKRERSMSFDVFSLGTPTGPLSGCSATTDGSDDDENSVATACIGGRSVRVKIKFAGMPMDLVRRNQLQVQSDHCSTPYHTDTESEDAFARRGCQIGVYSPEARRAKIRKFHAKRHRRVWNKKIKYDCRKKLADDRPRIKGRFVKSDEDGTEIFVAEESGEEDLDSALMIDDEAELDGDDEY